MIIKYYEKIKEFMKQNYLMLLFYLVFIATFTYPLPYYIYTGGGLMDASSKVEVVGEKEISGSFNFLYVSQINATIPTYLLAQVIPTWDIESISAYQVSEEETLEEMKIRDKLYLEEGNTSATFVAYRNANKTLEIIEEKHHITYILNKDKTNLKIGDVLLQVNGKSFESIEEIRTIVNSHSVGEKLSLTVERDGKEIECYAEIYEENGEKYIGISFLTTYDYELSPSLEIKFKRNESGPSGGLILALTIYDKLVDEDITKGYKIAGTGTIDIEGNVGTIGGVEYKLRGAVEENSDIIFVPNGENYDECIKIKNEEDLDIDIIGVSTFEEALTALKNYSK